GCQVFGDEDYVFVVESHDGRVGASRALRAQDGVSIPVADFATAFQNRVRFLGRHLLVKDSDSKSVTLRLYDVLEGKDLWKKEFPLNSVVLKTEDSELAGVVDPDGRVTAFDLATGKEVFRAALLPQHIEKAQTIYLLQDSRQFYVLINLPQEQNANLGRVVQTYPNVLPQS